MVPDSFEVSGWKWLIIRNIRERGVGFCPDLSGFVRTVPTKSSKLQIARSDRGLTADIAEDADSDWMNQVIGISVSGNSSGVKGTT